MDCPICYEASDVGFTCSRCKQSCCEECYIKLLKNSVETNVDFTCPLCRHKECVAAPVVQEFPIVYRNPPVLSENYQIAICTCFSIGCIAWKVIWCVHFIGV